MVYSAKQWRCVYYEGNKVFGGMKIEANQVNLGLLENRVQRIMKEEFFSAIQNLDNAVFFATIDYFRAINAKRVNLPMTTLMISSPWEVYAWRTLDYTTDTLPIEVPDWFWSWKRIFLSESSQFYLELQLLVKGAEHLFSIYNSFRKERSDATHLSEFQHVEYEGKISYEENITIFMGLYNFIMDRIFTYNISDLQVFLTDEDLKKKKNIIEKFPCRISLYDALKLLYEATWEKKYTEFSLKYFWTWEEIKLTELLWGNVIVEKFPMLEIPFYHAVADEEINWIPLAKNADFILSGYRETIGSWERIKEKRVLLEKAKIFNLPPDDYLPYLVSRDVPEYMTTSWFWMGWQRLIQWITNQPYIYESTLLPRTHLIPNP